MAAALAGRAGARLAILAGCPVRRTRMLRLLIRTPLPDRPTSAVLSVDDFAVRRSHRYASLLIDAVTHQRIDVLPDRKAATLTDWLASHPGVEIVCRDGSASYAQPSPTWRRQRCTCRTAGRGGITWPPLSTGP